MTVKEICTELARSEAGKRQAKIGDIRELVGIISDLMIADEDVVWVLLSNGKRRAKKAKKK